tara:strand:+ start:456 stop:1208 length:753 start_codon:yes stop_codon:yes gene_type:complete
MRKLIVETAKRVNKKLVDKIARGRELKAGVNPSNPRARAARNRIRRGAQKTAKNIYKGTAAGTGATAVGGGVAASRVQSKKRNQNTKTNKPATKKTATNKPAAKTQTKGKTFNAGALMESYKKATTPAKTKPKKPLGPEKPTITKTKKLDPTRDGKGNKLTTVPKVKGTKPGQNKGKLKVHVGGSIIRNRDGSIKKVKPPSVKGLKLQEKREKAQKKAEKNPYAKMTRSQINRLSGKAAAAYRKYMKGKK